MSSGYCIFTFEGGNWIRDDFPGLEEGFRQARELGFDYVEIPSLLHPDRTRTDHEFTRRMGRIFALSERYDVPVSAVFASVNLLDDATREQEIDELLVLARLVSTAGITILPVTAGIDRIATDQEPTARLARILSEVGEQTARFGVKIAVHPHIDCPIETPAQIDEFLAASDPRFVGLCLDAGHVIAGGGDPLLVARQHSARVDYVHLKDVDLGQFRALTGEDRYSAFRDPGEGTFDFKALLAQLFADGFSGPVLAENDFARDPIASMRRSAKYLQTTLGL